MTRAGVVAVVVVLILGLALALALAVVGPGGSPRGATGPPGEGQLLDLPTVPGQPAVAGAPLACAGVGLSTVLRGDPADPRVAWLERLADRTRMDVVWPAGYRARFAPRLEVLDASGAVVARDGDAVEGACAIGNDRLEVVPDPPMFAVACGPIPVTECLGGNLTYQVRETLRSLFPGRDPDVVRFTTPDGAYIVTFADGGRYDGHVRPGG
jgi:hypothetical protein